MSYFLMVRPPDALLIVQGTLTSIEPIRRLCFDLSPPQISRAVRALDYAIERIRDDLHQHITEDLMNMHRIALLEDQFIFAELIDKYNSLHNVAAQSLYPSACLTRQSFCEQLREIKKVTENIRELQLQDRAKLIHLWYQDLYVNIVSHMEIMYTKFPALAAAWNPEDTDYITQHYQEFVLFILCVIDHLHAALRSFDPDHRPCFPEDAKEQSSNKISYPPRPAIPPRPTKRKKKKKPHKHCHCCPPLYPYPRRKLRFIDDEDL